MTKQTQQMPLLMIIGSIATLTEDEVKQIKQYIELDTILDVQFKDAAGEVMIPIGYVPEVKNAEGEVTANPYVTVVKNGSIVKAEITEKLPTPVIKGATPFEDSTKVTIEAREGCTIYYTDNGDTPTAESTEYEGEITLSATKTIKAIAIKGELSSSVASKEFTKFVAAPEISGETPFETSTEVEITAAEGATIYYTNDGTTPTAESTEYTEKLTLEATATIKAIAVKGGITSEVASKTFTKSEA